MPELAQNAAFQVYALCSAILAIHLLFVANWTAVIRVRNKWWVNPEDAQLNKGKSTEVDHAAVLRVKRVHMNAVENVLPFFALGLLYVILGGSKTGAQAYFFTFTAARILHSVFYLAGLQPFRTISFVVGALVVAGLAVQVIMHVT